jgi:hypothetical protein
MPAARGRALAKAGAVGATILYVVAPPNYDACPMRGQMTPVTPTSDASTPRPGSVPNRRAGSTAPPRRRLRYGPKSAGGRNNRLNRAAFCLGMLVAGGELDGTPVDDEVLAAALDAGLPEAEARASVASWAARQGGERRRRMSLPVKANARIRR